MNYYAVFHLSTYIAGILYFIVFMSELESLRMFEQFVGFNPNEEEIFPSVVVDDQSIFLPLVTPSESQVNTESRNLQP